MEYPNFTALDEAHILPTYGRFGPCLVQGKGCRATDINGKNYLDFTSGIGVNSLGWCDDEWAAAICGQAGRLQHVSNLFGSLPGAQLAQKLCNRTGMSKVFFANSGAEANEGAIKAARKYSAKKYGAGRSKILSVKNSFHGRTLAALAATGQPALQQDFDPLPPGFAYLPADDIPALQATCQDAEVCAIMLEPIQGEGGVLPFSPAYLAAVQAACNKHDLLLIADEIQTGVGRTGQFLACGAFGLQPDIVTLAKGLGGGLPIGAILFNEKAACSLGKGDHGSTFGMNPVVCAGALVVMDRLTDEFLQEVAQKGETLKAGLAALPGVCEVTGLGLMLGIKLKDTLAAAALREKAQEKGLLCLLAKDRLRLLPPLVISREEIEEGLGILRRSLESFL